ncbi:MAG: hypothetical protein ABMB14_09910 [Myxococcota bacterium]
MLVAVLWFMGCERASDAPTDPGPTDPSQTDPSSPSDPPDTSGTTPRAGCAYLDGVARPSLADALAEAVAGSTVAPCPGTHHGAFVASVAVHLVGEPGDRTRVVLDGDALGTTLTLAPGAVVEDLTIVGGKGQHGGGVALSAGGTATLTRVTISGSSAQQGGGLWLPDGSTVEVIDSELRGNSAADGGGLWAGPGSVVDLTDTVIVGNNADRAGGGGYLDGVALAGGTFDGNLANSDYYGTGTAGPLYAAGLYLTGAGSVVGTVITGNQGGAVAGAAVIDGDQTLVGVRIAENDGGGGAIGGLYCESSAVDLGDSEIADNVGAFGGGYLAGCAIRGGVVDGNEGVLFFASGLMAIGSTLDGVRFEGNTSVLGPVLDLVGGNTVTASTFTGNVHRAGPVLRAWTGDTIDGCTVEGNVGPVGLEVAAEGVRLTNTTLRDAVDPASGGGAAVRIAAQVKLVVEGGALLGSDRGVALDATLIGATLELIDVDLGDLGDDNSADVRWSDGDHEGYGAGTTVSCTDTCR